MKFFMIIGKDDLYVYEKEGSQYKKQFIEGNPSFSYELSNIQEDIKEFLELLANEKNLGEKTKLEFDVLENENKVYTNAVIKSLQGCVSQRIDSSEIIKMVFNELKKDKKLQIEQYGINYDGVSYKMENQKLIKGEFDLLAYTICADNIGDFL